MTTTTKPDPKPSQRKSAAKGMSLNIATGQVESKPLTAAQKRAETKRLKVLADAQAAENAKLATKGVLTGDPEVTIESTIESTPADEGAPDPRQVMPTVEAIGTATIPAAAMARLSAAATASAERRAKNAADRAKVKALNADERTARRAAIDTWHAQVIADFKAGKTIKQIAEGATNPKTGKLYTASTIHWILVKHGVVEKGAGRVKFDISTLTKKQRDRAESAYAALAVIAEEAGTSVATLVKTLAS